MCWRLLRRIHKNVNKKPPRRPNLRIPINGMFPFVISAANIKAKRPNIHSFRLDLPITAIVGSFAQLKSILPFPWPPKHRDGNNQQQTILNEKPILRHSQHINLRRNVNSFHKRFRLFICEGWSYYSNFLFIQENYQINWWWWEAFY